MSQQQNPKYQAITPGSGRGAQNAAPTGGSIAPGQAAAPQPALAVEPHPAAHPAAGGAPNLAQAIQAAPQLFIRQKKQWAEVFAGFEQGNKYVVMTEHGQELGAIVEKRKGFWDMIVRQILKSHQSKEIGVFNLDGTQILHMRRPFFWFFSDMAVTAPNGSLVGSVHRRFGIINKKYDLRDGQGQTFARIKSPLWRLWTFPVIGEGEQPAGSISKKWGGALKEMFTDADTFRVAYEGPSSQWDAARRAVMFAAAIIIDFDFFENNSNRGVGLSLLDG